MRQTKIGLSVLVLGLLALVATGCSSNSYSNKRKAEDKLIKNYLNRNKINILTEWPADDYKWGEKDYYKVTGYDDLYYHLIKQGDSIRSDNSKIEPVKSGQTIIMRYKKFALTENPDTISQWNTLDQAYPTEFTYPTDATNACTGWHVAVSLMQYSKSECIIICPSKQGFSTDNTNVTPYCYILQMTIKP